jgi:hypothetical protein
MRGVYVQNLNVQGADSFPEQVHMSPAAADRDSPQAESAPNPTVVDVPAASLAAARQLTVQPSLSVADVPSSAVAQHVAPCVRPQASVPEVALQRDAAARDNARRMRLEQAEAQVCSHLYFGTWVVMGL